MAVNMYQTHNKLERIAEMSMRLNEGNTRRAVPMKKIAEIKKA